MDGLVVPEAVRLSRTPRLPPRGRLGHSQDGKSDYLFPPDLQKWKGRVDLHNLTRPAILLVTEEPRKGSTL